MKAIDKSVQTATRDSGCWCLCSDGLYRYTYYSGSLKIVEPEAIALEEVLKREAPPF